MALNQTSTTRYTAQVTTVEPANNQIELVTKTGAPVNVLVVSTGVAWRWPVVGESWVVRQENGAWYLDGIQPNPNTTATVTLYDVPPGNAIINSSTGVVNVMGSSDGSTDFSFEESTYLQNAAGAASTNIGTLGGVLSGTLPNPTFEQYLFRPAKAYWSAAGANTYPSGVAFPFDTVSFDLTGGSMTTGVGAGFSAPTTGYYFVASSVGAAPTGGGQTINAAITVGGVTNYRVNLGLEATTVAQNLEITGSGIVAATAGQKIQLVWTGTTSVTGLGSTENLNNLMVMRVA